MSLAEQLDALMGNAGVMPGRDMSRFGLTLARVTNITDDQNFNRVKCLPIGSEAKEETDWCYVMTPMGGIDRGMFFFPQVDDLVVLAYLDQDVHRPLVLGGFWNTEVTPPYTVQDGVFHEYSIRTPTKTELLLYDEEEKQTATLVMPSGTMLRLDDENKKIQLQDKEGENSLVMDLEPGEITMKAKSKITLDVGGNQIIIDSDGNITIKGSATIKIEGADIQAKASNSMKMEATDIQAKATNSLKMESAQMDLSATMQASLKGGMVKIN